MKHRKLYPSSTNQTLTCPDVCDPSCPYYCYPDSETYAMPPPLPPPPPPLSINDAQNVSPYVIIIASLLGVAFVIVIYYLLVARSCAGLNIFRPRRRQQGGEGTQEDLLDENRGPAVIDHPIWYIRTVGLQPSIINSIAVFKYKKGDCLIEGTHCSICLNEFQDDDILRLLPKCDHAFHIPCIDTWLRSHTNCPVCRSGIITNSMATPVAPNGSYYNNANRDEIGSNRVQDIELSTTDGGLGNSLVRNSEHEQNRMRTREEFEFQQVGIEVQAAALHTRVDLDENDASWVIDEDSDGNSIVNDEIQQMRRSVSADCLLVAKNEDKTVDRNGNAHKSEPGDNNVSKSKTPMIDSDGVNISSRPGPVSMKRSLSCGGRSFFSRHTRSLSSILPP